MVVATGVRVYMRAYACARARAVVVVFGARGWLDRVRVVSGRVGVWARGRVGVWACGREGVSACRCVGRWSAAEAVMWWRRRPALISFGAGAGAWREEDRDGLVGVIRQVGDVILLGVRGRVGVAVGSAARVGAGARG